MENEKLIALVAHDGAKEALAALVERHLGVLHGERLVATATTGALIAERFGLTVRTVRSGPLGGDLQLGALVADEAVKLVVFLRDPLTPHPHDPDIQALMKVCDVHGVPLATNVATAELCLGALTLMHGVRGAAAHATAFRG